MTENPFNLNNFDGVAFDIDGTLANSMPTYHDARLRAFARHGFDDITRVQHELGPTYGSTSADIIGGILQAAGKIRKGDRPFAEHPVVQRVLGTRMAVFEELATTRGFEEQPGASDFVKVIMERFTDKVAFVTASPLRHVGPFLERYDLYSRVDPEYVIDEEVITLLGLGYKPLPDPYQLARKRLGIARMLVFEDNVSGVASGKRAGATVIAMGFDRHNTALFAGAQYPPDAIVMNYDEARELVGLPKIA